MVQKKIKGRMQYPLEIDMRPYTTTRRTRMGEKAGGDEEEGRFLYELESVIVHEGKAIEQGHYFAFCRGVEDSVGMGKGTATARREWYMFNDAKVTAAAEPLVLEQEAYLLFYSLKRICGKR